VSNLSHHLILIPASHAPGRSRSDVECSYPDAEPKRNRKPAKGLKGLLEGRASSSILAIAKMEDSVEEEKVEMAEECREEVDVKKAARFAMGLTCADRPSCWTSHARSGVHRFPRTIDNKRCIQNGHPLFQSTNDMADILDSFETRQKYSHFRILVIGRANAGKTTLLKRVCNTTEDPRIYDEGKNLVRLLSSCQRSTALTVPRQTSWSRPQR
jgi:ATPase subunit of ABC transporter with duplicated ATPase domains